MNPNNHLGHMILNCFRQRPDAICVLDAATGLSATNATVASRSISLARSLRKAGYVPGDVVALSGRNHLDLHIPYYAALFNGLPLFGVDPLFKFDEIKTAFKLVTPKITFCEPKDYGVYHRAIQELGLDTKILTFGDGDHSINEFIKQNEVLEPEDSFEPATFQPEKTYIWLISTSGTTGKMKVAAFDYRTFGENTVEYVAMIRHRGQKESKENALALNLSPIQWISGMFNPVGMPLLGQCIVQTSAPATTDHVIDIINKYRPVQVMLGPSVLSYILKHEKKCDLTCFNSIIIGGGKVSKELLTELKKRVRSDARAVQMYGQTETLGPVFVPVPPVPPESVGKPIPSYQVKLVDPESGKEITKPFVTGELWTKGRSFTEYYNDPEETARAFSEGWYKSGDLLYRDNENNYYFVDRLKTLIKYQNYHITPRELEEVILTHPGVYEAVVTGVPHADDGERAVACVVRRPGATVTAREIQDLVANKLSEKKQLHGVVFLEEIPLASNGKILLNKCKEIAITATKEALTP